MDLNDDVGLSRQADSDALRQAMGLEAGGPEAQFVGFKPGAILCRIAGPRGIFVEHAPPPQGIDVGDEMMHGAARGWSVVDSFDVVVLREVGRQNEAPVDIGPGRGHLEVFGWLEDQVWRPELPALGERAWRRKIFRVSERGTCLSPGSEHADLLGGQRLVVLELRAEAAGRLPRRHRTLFGDEGDVMGALARLLVSLECERPNLVAAMAALALRLEDRGDILRVGRGVLRHRRGPLPRCRWFVGRCLVRG